MKILVRRRAKLDLLEARRWYEERERGLGSALLTEVEELLEQIRQHPEIYPRVDERIRRAALRRFPYGMFYVVDGDTLRVIAILHRARSPEAWKRR